MELNKNNPEKIAKEDGSKQQVPNKSSSKFKRGYDVQFDLGSHLHYSILPLLQQPTTNLSKHDVINLANTLVKLKKYILDFDLSFSIEFKDFFYSLVALSSNCIITNISAITKNQVKLTAEACGILLKYLFQLMSNDNKQKNSTEDVARKFQKLNLVYAFCGQTNNNLLTKCELDSLCAILKSSKLPNELMLGDKKNLTCSDTTELKEFKRIKIDRADYLIDHLSLPIIVKRNQTGFSFSEDQDKDVKQNVFQKNLLTLRQLDAIEVLLEFISSFPNIRTQIDYLNRLKSADDQSSLFNESINLKDDLKASLDEFTKLINILSLPILENTLNDLRLKLILELVQSLIYACVNLVVRQSIAELNCSNNEKNYDLKERHSLIRSMISLILKFYKNKLNSLLKHNQQLIQNVHLFSTWISFSGLEHLLNVSIQNKVSSDDDSKTVAIKSATTELKETTKSISYLCSLIVNHGLETFGFILEDLVYDFNKDEQQSVKSKTTKTKFYQQFDIQASLTASERVKLLMNEIQIFPLIFEISYSSFIQACDLFNKTALEDDFVQETQLVTSQRNYNRSDDSTKDDDSEPILGRLFNENEEFKKNEQNRKQDLFGLEKSTNEIQESIDISKNVILFLNTYFICSESNYERTLFKNSLNATQIELLSSVIKKLDCLDEDKQIKEAFKDYSKIFSLFIHNLIATESLTDELMTKLLEQLNVHPTISSKENYHFFIKPRALSVLAQVLMIKIKHEKDTIKSDKNSLGLLMWKGVLDRLIELIKTKDTILDTNDEDINLEHAQLLMFVFHNTTLLQRKSIALDLCQRIFDLSEFLNLTKNDCLTNHQLLYLSRLLHFFEYIIKNLYEVPQHLLEQINSNLFEFYSTTRNPLNLNALNSNGLNSNSNGHGSSTAEQFELTFKLNTCLKEHLKSTKIYDKFYDLLYTEHKQFEYSQRLNDIALNFLFYFKSDKLKYEHFYKAILQFLLIGNYFNPDLLNEKDLCQCNAQYCFNIIWRLFLLLPPSIEYLSESNIEQLKRDPLKILTVIIWQPRLVQSKYYRNFLLATIKKQSSNEQNIEQLIENYLKHYTPISFNIDLVKSYVDEFVIEDKIPSIFDQFILECLISRLWIILDQSFNNSKQSSYKIETNEQIQNLIQEYSTKLSSFLPDILSVLSKLLRIYYTYFKDTLLKSIEFKQGDTKSNFNLLKSYNDILSISADEYFTTNANIVSFFPVKMKNVWKFLNDRPVTDLFNENWKNKLFKNDLPTEQLIMENWRLHFFQLSTTYSKMKQDLYSSSQLAYTIVILLRSTESLITWFKAHHKKLSENEKLRELVTVNFMKILTPLNTDYTLQSLSDFCKDSIDYIWDLDKNEEFQIELKLKVLETCYSLVTEQYEYVDVDTKVECVKQFKFLLNSYAGQSSLESFFCDNLPSSDSSADILTFFKSAARKEPNNKYAVSMLKFLIKLIEETDNNLESVALVRLCSLLKKFGDKQENENENEKNWIEKWFYKLLCVKESDNNLMSFNEENYLLIKKLTSYIVKGSSIIDESVSIEFVKSLISIATTFLNTTNDKMSFPELMILMTTLASKDNGTSHFILIKASIDWLNICINYLSKKEVLEKIEMGITVGRHQIILHSVSYILSYLELVLEALRSISIEQSTDEQQVDTNLCNQEQLDWTDDLACDDDETTSEGSEEDTINSRLCTFTVTQKEFMNQHWYHCHTCKMVDGVGICSVCAKVCHKSHDVTYSIHGSFFCDCGAKEDGSCQALVERTSTIEKANVYKLPAYIYAKERTDQLISSHKKLSSDSAILTNLNKQKLNLEKKISLETLCKQLKDHKDNILAEFKKHNVCSTVIKLLNFLSKSIVNNNQRFSPIDRAIRTRNALDDLHRLPKTCQKSDQLAIPTLSSQEGAFENIKTNFNGEQGQRIKSLLTNNLLKRVGMTLLNQKNGKKQHLAISHEKGKITILQLSSLLKQIDSSKKKINLTRLSSASVPFTVLTIASNPHNDSVLSVCGLKDCHVLTFNSSGHLSGHLILQLNLKKLNYIIKSIWLPDSQSELAIITADFVNIYNLSESLTNPVYCFELPGKIRDATFLFTADGKRYFLFLSTQGEVYYEQLNSKSQSQNSPYFVTSQIEFKFKEDFQTVIGKYQFNDGGVSIFYSHLFQLLFISYENGTTLAIPMKDLQQDAKSYFLINVQNADETKDDQTDMNTINLSASATKSDQPDKSPIKKSKFKPVFNWFEVANHPGLIMASTRDENNPVIFSITPETISYQEIKENIKTKIVDTVAIRHSTNSDTKTTIVVLCEDGSLQIFNAFNENTNYWLNPIFNCKQIVDKQSLIMSAYSKSKKSKKSSKKLIAESNSSGREVSFPIDFFESTQQITDVEFGGNDLLQIYNSAQLKNRLLGQTTYIVCTKANGFTLEITNNDPSMVVVGIRVLLGTQSVPQTPSFIEVFDRYINIQLTKHRWFDIPFTKEETLLADNRFNVYFGPPNDASTTTYVDSVLVYGKARELFLWPDEESESCNINAQTSSIQNTTSSDLDIVSLSCLYIFDLNVLERVLSSSFEIVNDCLLIKNLNLNEEDISNCLNISTELLTLPFPILVHQKLKNLLLQLHSNKQSFFAYRDTTVLNYILKMLLDHKELNGEPFSRILNLLKSVLGYRSNNFVKFIESMLEDYNNGEMNTSTKFVNLLVETFELDVKKEKLTVKTIFISIMNYLDQLYWNFYRKWPKYHLAIYSEGNFVLELITQLLVEVIYCFALINEDYLPETMDIYMKFFCAENTIINYNTKQSLMLLLRSKKSKRISKQTNLTEDEIQTVQEPKKSQSELNQSLAEVVQLDDDSDNNADQPSRFIEDFENQFPGLNNLAEDLINDSVNEDDIERLPLYQILNESLLDNDEEFLDNNAISINLPDQPMEISPRVEQAPSSSSFQQQSSQVSEQSIAGPSTSQAPDIVFKNFDKLATSINDFYIPNVNNEKTHNIKILLLENMIKKLDQIKNVGGIRCIPFMQIVLMIAFELDARKEKEKQILIKLINGLLDQLKTENEETMIERNPVNEVKLIIMRLLSILMSRFKSYTTAILSQKSPSKSKDSSDLRSSSTTTTTTNTEQQQSETFSLIWAKETVKILIQSDLIDIILKVLNALIKYWTEYQQLFESTRTQKSQSASLNNEANVASLQLSKPALKTTNQSITLDRSPFFIKQYVKGHTEDVFELFPQLLSEMVIRLPYQIMNLSNILGLKTSFTFNEQWTDVLCQYMMLQLTPYVRKRVRKLLTFICGSKDKYRQTRDFHSLNTYMKEINKLCLSNTPNEEETEILYSFSYDNTILLIENLKLVLEIATNRTINWQKFCWKNSDLLCFFIKVSIFLDESVSNTILQLLQLAICTKTKSDQSTLLDNLEVKQDKSKKDEDIVVELVETKKVKEKKEDEKQMISYALAKQLIEKMNTKLLSNFIRTFLLESNNTLLRWQCHALIYKMFENFKEDSEQHAFLLESLWFLWDSITRYGPKADQFVDLLGYFTFKASNQSKQVIQKYVEKTLNILNQQNQQLFQHSNFIIYNNLQKIVNFDGYYLESEPCLVCNNPETNYSNLKLSSLKVDSRFTTTTQIVKLVGSHIISKINLRITDIKKTKMVKVINIYYNNWPVNSVVELKNRTIWHKAKRCYLNSGQSEVKIEFPLPITACNLKIEYAEFYESQQSNTETLQCPRCSTTVPANPGMCTHCGENVHQCFKCRSIYYDEKDPFLCNSCGFCKYAKFDFILLAKVTCAVDPIKDEEGRKKTVQNINSLLERADSVYKNLNAIKPALEVLLLKNQEHGFIDKMPEETTSIINSAGQANLTASCFVNKTIQQIAFKYCNECKALFEELSKIIQKLLASRKELVIYDNVQRLETYSQFCDESTGTRFVMRRDSKMFGLQTSSSGKCFGCATASIQHCITLLKGLAVLPVYRELFCENGLLKILMDQNLKLNNLNLRKEVRQLLSLLLKDNLSATQNLEQIINAKIDCITKAEFKDQLSFVNLIKNEVAFLSNALETDDIYWEIKLRCLIRLFFVGMNEKDPNILNAIILPTLRIISNLIKIDFAFNVINDHFSVCIDEWLKSSDSSITSGFEQWKLRKEQNNENRERQLQFKYFNCWKVKVRSKKLIEINLQQFIKKDWIKSLIFNKYSLAVRMMSCSLIESFFQATNKKIEIVHLLTSYLDDINEIGICSNEFFNLYTNIIKQDHWKYYLALKGLLPHLGKLINVEIERLLVLDDENINSDLSDGLTLKLLVDLLISFVDLDLIRHYYKSKLVVFILNGYLSLRKLVVRRTKIIDETQDNLLELLEEMTTGTESETSSFMSVCVQSVKSCKLDDLRTPVFIFERLCSIIYSEDNTTFEFYITLEKDSAQEDFLQGRMLGNPYSSLDPGFGPLMRDIKNKICQDCELVALLDDDSGMELLVMDKIISLDLPVKDVYRKIWCTENNESHPMLIIYRMRGLMGDATEEFIENLDSKNVENENTEEVYRMAKVMSNCGGLEVMLERLNQIKDLTARCKPLLIVLLKLFDQCVKLGSNRKHLINPKLNAITIMMKVLKIIIYSPSSSLSSETSQLNKSNLLEQILKIIEVLLLECSKQSSDLVEKFLLPVTINEFEFLLHSLQSENVQKNANVLNLILRIIPFLIIDSKGKMQMVLEHFKPYLNFNKFDYQNTPENSSKLENFCIMVNSIEKNEICHKFKDFIVSENVVVEALEYLTSHSPPIKCALLANSKEWKEFTTRPSLKYVLRILTGITSGHELSQILVTSQYIAIIHGLEQVSSDAHVGSLAENLLEALKQNEHVAATIEKVRKETKEEKKRLAMAVRQKQLGELGLKANERGQVIAKSSVLKQVEDLGEEQGLTCIICREGYKFQPNKVLGIYTFTKKCPLEPFETKSNKTLGYSTVTTFNIIHFDCHLSAVKHARLRDEWESAALQNGNTKCNGLLPLWGPKVQDSVFESCLVHHNSYLQESTNCREISYTITLHDFKLLLLKFANEESFAIDIGASSTGQSGFCRAKNIHLIPYLIHMALYVMNTTHKTSRNMKMVKMFIEEVPSRFVENSFEVENVFYYSALHVLIFSSNHWNGMKIKFLQRFIITGHSRRCASKGKSINTLTDKKPKDYKDYKTELIFFALIDGLYKYMFKVEKPKNDDDESWSQLLADYIRHNDQQLLENAEQLLQYYEQDLLPCSTFDEFCDITGLLSEIPNPQQFLVDTLQMV